PGEVEYAVKSPAPRRVLFDLRRIMRSNYRIDAYQETYFVIDAFQQLFDATEPDFTPLYEELKQLPDLPADAALPEDQLVASAASALSPGAPRAPAAARPPRSPRGGRKPRTCNARSPPPARGGRTPPRPRRLCPRSAPRPPRARRSPRGRPPRARGAPS